MWSWLIVVLLLAAPGSRAQFGYIPTPKHRLSQIDMAKLPFCGSELPESVDLSPQMPPPGQQGKQGSCVAWATAYALKSFQEKLELNWSLADSSGYPEQLHVFSPSFIYNQINNGRDGGCHFEDALNLLRDQGIATLAEMPYNPSDYQTKPNSDVASRASRYRIERWDQVEVSNIKIIKAHLNNNCPIVFGAEVDEKFKKTMSRFVWTQKEGETLGLHAMVLVGYDDRKRAFKLINSWGREWGDRGYGWIAYDFFPKVVHEAFVAKDARNDAVTTNPRPSPDGRRNPFEPPVIKPQVARVDFRITNVMHNIQDRNGALWLRIDGVVSIPPGVARQDQIVVHFFFDAGGCRKGYPVASRSPQFATVNGFAAVGTMVYPVPPQGLTAQWTTSIPYNALALMPGTTGYDYFGRVVYQPRLNYLVLEPVLFLDGYGHASGGLVPFGVTQ